MHEQFVEPSPSMPISLCLEAAATYRLDMIMQRIAIIASANAAVKKASQSFTRKGTRIRKAAEPPTAAQVSADAK